MISTNIMDKTSCRKVVDSAGCFSLLEYHHDISVNKTTAETEYYASLMNVHKRQVICEVGEKGIIMQAGAMQWIAGDVSVATGVKGAGDLMKKAFGAKVTGETIVKPHYTGDGIVVLEPTYKHILFEDISKWGEGMVIEDSLFLACEDTVNMSVVARSTLSSAALGGEGLFNSCLSGKGIAVLESRVPRDELIVMEMTEPQDVIKIDGNMAIAWSKSLQFTVERTTKSLIGSAASGEGLVNVYRGVGKILMVPVG